MAIISYPVSEIEKHFKLTKEIQERINLFGTPIENVSSEKLEIEVLPNRPDLIPVYGFIRAIKTFISNMTKNISSILLLIR